MKLDIDEQSNRLTSRNQKIGFIFHLRKKETEEDI
jgi:hypothetical protein